MKIFSENEMNSYVYSIVIYIFICISLLINSYFSINGNLSPDSTNYLAFAQNLIDNGSFYLNYYGKENEWFAVWPLGYPTMIYLVAKIAGVSVFLASKVLNLLIVGVIFIIFNYKFKENGFVFSSIFLLIPFLTVFSYTWSEAPFILGMLVFSISLHKYIEADEINYMILFIITISAIFLFLSRYIGAFSVGVIGLAFIYLVYHRNLRKALMLVIPILIGSAFMILYLYNNYLQTGFFTGTERVSAPESIVGLIKMTVLAFIIELNLFTNNMHDGLSAMFGDYFGYTIFLIVILLQYSVFYLIFKKYSSYNTQIKKRLSIQKLFLIIGLLYYGAIVIMRWTSSFDPLDYRLLIPGTFLILVSIILYSKESLNPKGFYRFKLSFIMIAVLSFGIYTLKPFIRPVLMNAEIRTYRNYVNELREETENIPPTSVIITTNEHLNYIRPDLIRINLTSEKITLEDIENWHSFILRLQKNHTNKSIFIYAENLGPTKKIADLYDVSIFNNIKESQDGKILELR